MKANVGVEQLYVGMVSIYALRTLRALLFRLSKDGSFFFVLCCEALPVVVNASITVLF